MSGYYRDDQNAVRAILRQFTLNAKGVLKDFPKKRDP
jgi:hypothetical protein